MKFYALLLVLVCVSCATRTPVTDKLAKNAESTLIKDVPVIKQDDYHCGPATLAMVMQFHGTKISAEEAAKGLFHKNLKGSFFSEMKAKAREEGFVVVEVNELEKAFTEVKAGNPVIVLQNNGFKFFPQWHFAVLRGMNFEGPDVILNDGREKAHEMDMRMFERSFVLGGMRSLVVLPPEKLSATASERDHAEAAAMLEAIGKIHHANKAYVAMLERWPGNTVAVIGASNTFYTIGKKLEALKVLEMGPVSAMTLHNRAIIQNELGRKKEARLNAKKALELAEVSQKEKYRLSLKDLL